MTRIFVLTAPVLFAGCGGSASSVLGSYKDGVLSSNTDAVMWAKTGSARGVYSALTIPLGMVGAANLVDASYADPNCPKKTQDGNASQWQGDCTDRDENQWFGSAEQVLDAADSKAGRMTFRGFGYAHSVTCSGQPGTSKVTYEGVMNVTGTPEESQFDIDVRREISGLSWSKSTCTTGTQTAAWEYSGTLKRDGSSRTIWNGSGRVGNSESGVITVETADETVDSSTCAHEALSGTTTIKAGSNTAVITYDGATDCKVGMTVGWSLNGESKGELTGVAQ